MIDFCLSPLTWLLGCALLGACARARMWPRRLAAFGAAGSIALMTPLLANTLVKSVESQTPPASACAAATPPYVVVLAGGIDREPSGDDDTAALSADSLRRLLAGIALDRELAAGTPVLLVGGGPYATSESRLMERLAVQWGIAPAALTTERDSTTTWESAHRVAALSPPPPHRFWLVTSALHMPRALLAFRAAGFEPCPRSSGSLYLAPAGFGYFLPQTSALRKSEQAIHEIIGGLGYRLRRRIKARDPAPISGANIHRNALTAATEDAFPMPATCARSGPDRPSAASSRVPR